MSDPKQGWRAADAVWRDRAKVVGVVAVVGLLAWWGWSALSDAARSKDAQRRDRLQQSESRDSARARQLLREGPRTNTWATSQGTVIQIEIPVDRYKTGDVDFQRCYIWRDAVTPAVAMHCDQEATPDTGTSTPP